jgi:epoxyqueuosine reductase QueG
MLYDQDRVNETQKLKQYHLKTGGPMNLEEHPTVRRYRERAASAPAATGILDAAWLKELGRESGADDAAVVSMTSPQVKGHTGDILTLFPRTKSLISIVCRLNPENVRCPSRDVSDLEYLQGFERVNSAAKRIVTGLMEKGVRAINTSGGFPMDLSKWPGKMWPLSHKPIAVAGGLGVMGLHRLVIHPRFGSFVVLGTILLDREATAYDGPLDYNPCIGCGLCASVCPVGAVGADGSFNFTACMTHN